MADYAERYGEFKRAGAELVAVSPESRRKARRLRTTLKLPFTVLSDARLEAARTFGLLGPDQHGLPNPATVMLDVQGRVLVTSLNEGLRSTRSVLARDMLDYVIAHGVGTVAAIPAPPLEQPQPGWLFARGLANLAIGLVRR